MEWVWIGVVRLEVRGTEVPPFCRGRGKGKSRVIDLTSGRGEEGG